MPSYDFFSSNLSTLWFDKKSCQWCEGRILSGGLGRKNADRVDEIDGRMAVMVRGMTKHTHHESNLILNKSDIC